MADGVGVDVNNLTKRFGGFTAVDAVSFTVMQGEFFSLLGPSGCGKTTLLRMIAGLELPTSGELRIDGRDVALLPPHRRPVNTVFQHYALFPHLTVAKNVAFGLRYRGVTGEQERTRVAEALALVRLEGLESRMPGQLSGGQKQRVALARALVLQPRVLLLDEPLGALDQKLRREMQVELKQLQRRVGTTFIFVTHDQEEALTMSDRIALMHRGKVEQLDTAANVFERPRTAFAADFMGAANYFAGRVAALEGDELLIDCDGGFRARVSQRGNPIPVGGRACFVVRPEKLRFAGSISAADHAEDRVAGTIEQRVYQGLTTLWIVRGPGGARWQVIEQNTGSPASALDVGATTPICWRREHAVLLADLPSAPTADPVTGERHA